MTKAEPTFYILDDYDYQEEKDIREWHIRELECVELADYPPEDVFVEDESSSYSSEYDQR